MSMKKQQNGRIDVVLGAQWGDEGKGKLVDILSPRYQICARVAGGSNAGHTIVVEVSNRKYFYRKYNKYVISTYFFNVIL